MLVETALEESEHGSFIVTCAFRWGRSLSSALAVDVGGWLLVATPDSYVAEDREVGGLKRHYWPHGNLQELVDDTGEPPLEVVQRWKRSNSPLLRGAFQREGDIVIGLGTRVALAEGGDMEELRGGYVVGVGSFCGRSAVTVRIACAGQDIDPFSADFVQQLRSPERVGDIVLTWERNIRPHLFAGGSAIKMGDVVETRPGIHPRRTGTVQNIYRSAEKEEQVVRLQEPTTNRSVEVKSRDLRPVFRCGDVVKVVEGYFEGREGRVVKLLDLNESLEKGLGKGALRLQLVYPQNREREQKNAEVTMAQVQLLEHAPETGPTHWLAQSALVMKRLDVFVTGVGNCRLTAVRERALWKMGFIELSEALTDTTMDTLITVHMDEDCRKVTIPARCLNPARTHKGENGKEINLGQRPARVVIIGPDVNGDETRVGEYAQVYVVGDGTDSVVEVRFAGEVSEAGRYPLESLCRSTNKDGVRTFETRF
ncbi:ATP-dependent DNA helicase [Mycena chlorophos]|uniref:ATP-dependent DNA helicase n=1 Tax=Mycena chlorophos TaxID=658473 RepID=A0A8H6S8X7_MYCCL|nr:ATP-dependent DNA helicase [Mycena chlorophos]